MTFKQLFVSETFHDSFDMRLPAAGLPAAGGLPAGRLPTEPARPNHDGLSLSNSKTSGALPMPGKDTTRGSLGSQAG